MKKAIIALAFSSLLSTGAFAQGTILFNTRVIGDDGVTLIVDAPVTLNGSTLGVNGTAYLAQLYVGPTADSLVAVGTPVGFRTALNRAGYVDVSNAAVTTALPAGSTAFVAFKAWDASKGASYETALAALGAVGSSSTISVVLGGAGNPPSVPANLIGLQGFNMAVIPEPGVMSLAAIGGLGLLALRRKNA